MSKTHIGHFVKYDQETKIDYLCEMMSIIGNKLASLYNVSKQNTMYWLLYTNLPNKT